MTPEKALTVLRAAYRIHQQAVGRRSAIPLRPFHTAAAPGWRYLPAEDRVEAAVAAPNGARDGQATD